MAKTNELGELGQREELHHRGPEARSLFLPPNEFSSNFTFGAPVNEEGSLKKTVLNKRNASSAAHLRKQPEDKGAVHHASNHLENCNYL